MDFPKIARVRKRAEYLAFFQGSEVRRAGVCTLFRIPNQKGLARVGITVKARVDSVRRNRLKRAIREAFRTYRANLGSMDYNVVIPGAIRVDHRTVKSLRTQLRAVWGNENHF
jgi:ribonuclease P protein component